MAYKRKYHRGERITSFEDLLQEKIVYMGTDIRPKSILWVKSMQLNTILHFMGKYGIYKAVFGEGHDLPAGLPAEQIEGQINYFEGENDGTR